MRFLAKDYKLKRPKYDVDEAKRRDASYAVQMYVPTQLINKETKEIITNDVFIGDLPLMTDRGTFIINGAERVIVNQIALSFRRLQGCPDPLAAARALHGEAKRR